MGARENANFAPFSSTRLTWQVYLPGFRVGRVGSILGGQGVNIARMGLGRKPGSGRAIMLIEVDSEVPAAALAELGRLPAIREARFLKLG